MQPSAKCLYWLHFSDKIEFNIKTTTLAHRLYVLLACLFCRPTICLFKVCKRDSRLPLVLFNLSDVWWNPNVFNFTVSFIHSAGLHRCDGWDGLAILSSATDQLSPGAGVTTWAPHRMWGSTWSLERDAICYWENVSLNPGLGLTHEPHVTPIHSALLSLSWGVRGRTNITFRADLDGFRRGLDIHSERMEQIIPDTRREEDNVSAISDWRSITALCGDIGIYWVWIILSCTCYCAGVTCLRLWHNVPARLQPLPIERNDNWI